MKNEKCKLQNAKCHDIEIFPGQCHPSATNDFGGRGKVSAIMGDFGKGLRNFKTGLKGPEEEADAEAIEETPKAPAKKAKSKKKAAAKRATAKRATAKKASAKKATKK